MRSEICEWRKYSILKIEKFEKNIENRKKNDFMVILELKIKLLEIISNQLSKIIIQTTFYVKPRVDYSIDAVRLIIFFLFSLFFLFFLLFFAFWKFSLLFLVKFFYVLAVLSSFFNWKFFFIVQLMTEGNRLM